MKRHGGGLGVVAGACNPGYSGGGGKEDCHSLRLAWAEL
jgi:hypothetical protein